MTVSLIYSYLRYDAEQMIDKYATTWIESPTERFKSNLRSEELDEADLLWRLIATTSSRLHTELGKYLHRESNDATNAMREGGRRDYKFKHPSADGQSLADLMHWYVVRHVVAAWCMMQGRYKEAEVENLEADNILSSLIETLRKGSMPMKQGKAAPIPEDIIYIHYGTES